MLQDYRILEADQLELLEKQTLRTIVQALQQYSGEARTIFETTVAASDQEVIVLAEDLIQYALEVAECYPIDRRFAGFIDYKRVRWLSSSAGRAADDQWGPARRADHVGFRPLPL